MTIGIIPVTPTAYTSWYGGKSLLSRAVMKLNEIRELKQLVFLTSKDVEPDVDLLTADSRFKPDDIIRLPGLVKSTGYDASVVLPAFAKTLTADFNDKLLWLDPMFPCLQGNTVFHLFGLQWKTVHKARKTVSRPTPVAAYLGVKTTCISPQGKFSQATKLSLACVAYDSIALRALPAGTLLGSFPCEVDVVAVDTLETLNYADDADRAIMEAM